MSLKGACRSLGYSNKILTLHDQNGSILTTVDLNANSSGMVVNGTASSTSGASLRNGAGFALGFSGDTLNLLNAQGQSVSNVTLTRETWPAPTPAPTIEVISETYSRQDGAIVWQFKLKNVDAAIVRAHNTACYKSHVPRLPRWEVFPTPSDVEGEYVQGEYDAMFVGIVDLDIDPIYNYPVVIIRMKSANYRNGENVDVSFQAKKRLWDVFPNWTRSISYDLVLKTRTPYDGPYDWPT